MAGPVPVATVLGWNPASHRSCPLGKRSVTHPIREYGGEIFTDYYFGEANTAINTDNHHNNATNNFLIGVEFPGSYTRATASLVVAL